MVAHSDFLGSRMYACLGVTCHLHFGRMTRTFYRITCHCGNTGVERTPNKSQHTKLTLETKIPLPLLPGFELANYAQTNKLSQLPFDYIYFIAHCKSACVRVDAEGCCSCLMVHHRNWVGVAHRGVKVKG